jgi:ribosomal protein S18 acetylase RimI-like enzyme
MRAVLEAEEEVRVRMVAEVDHARQVYEGLVARCEQHEASMARTLAPLRDAMAEVEEHLAPRDRLDRQGQLDKHGSTVTVRKATDADLDALIAIENEPPMVGDTYCDDLLRLLIPATYVAVDGAGLTLGFVMGHALTPAARIRESRGFQYATRAPRPGAKLRDTLVVINIKVLRAHQGRGIGKRLVCSLLNRTTHRFVVYETPHVGTHVVAKCLLAHEYKQLPVREKTRRAYQDGLVAQVCAFERI